MARLVLIVAIIALGYWYWSGRHPESPQERKADVLAENAAIMQRCIRQEERMESAGGLAGVAGTGGSGEDAERVCAARNHLHKVDGAWYSGSE